MKNKTENTKIKDLILDPQNANTGTERGLRVLDDSLGEVGLGRSVVTDKYGTIIAGNKTAERAIDRGFEDAIVVHSDGKKLVVVQRDDLDLTDTDPNNKARALAYFDNRSAEVSLNWNPEQLQADKEAGVEVVERLWSPVELEILGAGKEVVAEDPGAQIDRAAQLQEKWQVVRGDVWTVGRHRIMCGDSTCVEDVEKLMDGVRADAVVTDPPYMFRGGGVPIGGKGGVTAPTVQSFSIGEPWGYTLDWIKTVKECGSKQNIIFCNSYMLGNICYELEKFTIMGCVFVWQKVNAPPSTRNTPRWDCEFIVWTKMEGNTNIRAGAFGSQVLNIPMPQAGCFATERLIEIETKKAVHPTQKPVAVMLPFIENLTELGWLVFDLFLGSGTTLVACEQTERVGFGMEISEAYVSVCLERLADMGLSPERT